MFGELSKQFGQEPASEEDGGSEDGSQNDDASEAQCAQASAAQIMPPLAEEDTHDDRTAVSVKKPTLRQVLKASFVLDLLKISCL